MACDQVTLETSGRGLLSFSRIERRLNTEKEARKEGLPSFEANSKYLVFFFTIDSFSTSLQHNIEHFVILCISKL